MIEATSEYVNEITKHSILISALLAGFSIAFIANLIVTDTKNRISNYLLIIATISASCFLICLFAMTKILMITTEGYPFKVEENEFSLARIIGESAFLIGMLSISTLIGLCGWVKSKILGIVTTVIGTLTLIIILIVS